MSRRSLLSSMLLMPALGFGAMHAAAASESAFNPQLSVILDGAWYADNHGGEAREILEEAAGFGGGHHHHDDDHDHAHGFDQGFNLREVEFVMEAAVDPYFDAIAIFVIGRDGDVDLEEAYATTRALPAGLQLKFGKFLSDIGYLNRQHPHDWHFVDRPLVNEMIFGDHGLQELGIQATWLAPTAAYTRLGIEVLQGESEGIANYMGGEILEGHEDVGDRTLSERSGPRLVTAFAKFGPDFGPDHAMRIGVSGGYAAQFHDIEEHGSRYIDADGDTWFAGLDWVHKFEGGGYRGHRNWTLQAEYFYRVQDFDLRVTPREEATHSAQAFDGSYRNRQDGAYLQGIYGIAPRWQLGARYDGLGFTNRVGEHSPGTSHRYTGMLSFMPTEFSRLRLQYAYGDILTADVSNLVGINETAREDFHQFFLQFIIGLGAHSAHAF